jgi:hypothetical protein
VRETQKKKKEAVVVCACQQDKKKKREREVPHLTQRQMHQHREKKTALKVPCFFLFSLKKAAAEMCVHVQITKTQRRRKKKAGETRVLLQVIERKTNTKKRRQNA